MGTYNLRRLCRPEILRAIDSRYLEELLAPYEGYLGEHGVWLPLSGREAPLKYLALVKLITAPAEDMPRELIDALYFIDELATPSGVEALEAAAKAADTPVPRCFCEVTPADIALHVWLRNRPLVERVHAEMAVQRFRSFDYFQPEAPKATELPGSLPARIRAVEAELNDCFQARRRGRYARILVDEREDAVWLYIGHGGLLKREGTVEKTGLSSICYRPEVYDAAVYVRDTGELGVHARSNWERDLYRQLLGRHLFGDERFFEGSAKYTLEPLRQYGRQAIQWIDVPEIEWVRLVQLVTYQLCRSPRTENHRSDDLFTSWEDTGPPFFPAGRILSAGFRVKILGCRSPRLVTIRPSNRAQYTRDVDRAWIEEWLKRRGFIRRREGPEDAGAEAVLAVA